MRWTPRRQFVVSQGPTFPQSVPDLIVPERVVPRLSFRKPLFRKQWRPEAVPPDVHAADLAGHWPAAAVIRQLNRGGRHAAAEPPEPLSAACARHHLPLEDPYR